MKKQTFTLRSILLVPLIILMAMPTFTYGQKKPKKKQADDDERKHDWDYTIVRNSPDIIAPLTLSFYPVDVSIEDLFKLSVSAKGYYFINDNFSGFARLKFDYLTTSSVADQQFRATKAPSFNFELGGIWFFSNNSVTGDEKVLLYSEGGGNYTINHVGKIEMQHQQKFGVRAAFGYTNTTMSSFEGSFSGYAVNDPAQTKINFISGDSSVLTNQHMGYFVIGLCSEKIRDYKVKFQNGVERNMSGKVTWYLDLLLSAFSTYDNVVSKYDNAVYNIDKYSTKTPWGLRLGFNYNSLTPFGLDMNYEIGVLPGGPEPEFFLSAKWGMEFTPHGNK